MESRALLTRASEVTPLSSDHYLGPLGEESDADLHLEGETSSVRMWREVRLADYTWGPQNRRELCGCGMLGPSAWAYSSRAAASLLALVLLVALAVSVYSPWHDRGLRVGAAGGVGAGLDGHVASFFSERSCRAANQQVAALRREEFPRSGAGPPPKISHIRYINVAKDTSRRSYMEGQLQNLSRAWRSRGTEVTWERIDAIGETHMQHGNAESISSWRGKGFSSPHLDEDWETAAGAYSHYTAIQGLPDSSDEGLVLIVGDDVEIREDLPEMWKRLWLWIPDEWDVLRLGWFGGHQKCSQVINSYIDLAAWEKRPGGVCMYCGLQAYVVNPARKERVLRRLEVSRMMSADELLSAPTPRHEDPDRVPALEVFAAWPMFAATHFNEAGYPAFPPRRRELQLAQSPNGSSEPESNTTSEEDSMEVSTDASNVTNATASPHKDTSSNTPAPTIIGAEAIPSANETITSNATEAVMDQNASLVSRNTSSESVKNTSDMATVEGDFSSTTVVDTDETEDSASDLPRAKDAPSQETPSAGSLNQSNFSEGTNAWNVSASETNENASTPIATENTSNNVSGADMNVSSGSAARVPNVVDNSTTSPAAGEEVENISTTAPAASNTSEVESTYLTTTMVATSFSNTTERGTTPSPPNNTEHDDSSSNMTKTASTSLAPTTTQESSNTTEVESSTSAAANTTANATETETTSPSPNAEGNSSDTVEAGNTSSAPTTSQPPNTTEVGTAFFTTTGAANTTTNVTEIETNSSLFDNSSMPEANNTSTLLSTTQAPNTTEVGPPSVTTTLEANTTANATDSMAEAENSSAPLTTSSAPNTTDMASTSLTTIVAANTSANMTEAETTSSLSSTTEPENASSMAEGENTSEVGTAASATNTTGMGNTSLTNVTEPETTPNSSETAEVENASSSKAADVESSSTTTTENASTTPASSWANASTSSTETLTTTAAANETSQNDTSSEEISEAIEKARKEAAKVAAAEAEAEVKALVHQKVKEAEKKLHMEQEQEEREVAAFHEQLLNESEAMNKTLDEELQQAQKATKNAEAKTKEAEKAVEADESLLFDARSKEKKAEQAADAFLQRLREVQGLLQNATHARKKAESHATAEDDALMKAQAQAAAAKKRRIQLEKALETAKQDKERAEAERAARKVAEEQLKSELATVTTLRESLKKAEEAADDARGRLEKLKEERSHFYLVPKPPTKPGPLGGGVQKSPHEPTLREVLLADDAGNNP